MMIHHPNTMPSGCPKKSELMILLTRARFFLLACLSLFLCGCVNNGYISSTITTGIGLDVSENPQTQVPHVRFGYIRNGLYYIPTGKTGNRINGDASETPNVVSKIHMSSKFMEGLTISEKFAVGEDAVQSKGARQLFADVSTETRGTVPSVPVVSGNGDSQDRYTGAIERKTVTVEQPKKVVISNRALANVLNGDIGALDDEGIKAALVVAKKTGSLDPNFKQQPQGSMTTDRDYLIQLVNLNVTGDKDTGQAMLKTWRGIIPLRPKAKAPATP
jgi:hypothetical protein